MTELYKAFIVMHYYYVGLLVIT